MALEIASAVHTPLPHPDMSSPNSNLHNLSFINSISDQLQDVQPQLLTRLANVKHERDREKKKFLPLRSRS